MPELFLCCALLCSHCRPFCAFRTCILLLQLCLLLKHLRSSAFSPFFTGFCHFRIFHTSLSAIFHTPLSPFFLHKNSCAFSYYLSFFLPDEACGRNVVNSTVCCSSVCCSLNCYTSILFVLHKCQNFFSGSHFGAAIVVFSACFGAAFCCLKFTSCWSTYVRPLSHLSLLGFVIFGFFTLRCLLFFSLRCHLFFFIKSCAFSYYLSFLLPDEACGRSVVNSTVCCSSVCCSLNSYTSILFVLYKFRNFFSVAHFCAAIVVLSARFGPAFCCFSFAFCWSTYVRPLSHLSLLGFVTFGFFTLRCLLFFILLCHLFFFIKTHTLSHTIFHFFYLMKPVDETSLILLSVVLWIIIRHGFSSYIRAGNFPLLRISVQPLLSFFARFCAALCYFNFAFCWSTYVRPLSHLPYWVLSLSYFSHFAVSYFSYFAFTFNSS